MRYLAIDLGQRRTGLALGDDVTGLATPWRVIETSSDNERWRQLCRAIEEESPGRVVVGLPLNMDGSAGPAAAGAQALADRLQRTTGLTIELQDERLSSADADALMARSGLTHKQKKARRDALAAAAILQRYLDRQASSEPPAPNAD
ncbi:MAG: Holliday junction resolvase RuvX [Planctomycetota bacterium]